MANVPRLSKILRGKDTKPQTELEAAIKYAIDNAGGGGGDEYETVAEIAVGTMQPESGMYLYVTDGVPFAPQAEDVTLYWGEDIALERLSTDMYAYNFDGEKAVGEPAYGLQLSDDATSVLAVFSDTNAIENTTVKILKKVSGGGSVTVDSELSETSENPVQNKVITAALADKADADDLKEPLIVHGTWASGNPNTVTITTPLADIYAEAQAGRAVFLEYTNTDTETGEIDTTRMGLVTYKNDNGAYALAFSICIIKSDKPAVAAVEFDNTLVGEFELAVGQ